MLDGGYIFVRKRADGQRDVVVFVGKEAKHVWNLLFKSGQAQGGVPSIRDTNHLGGEGGEEKSIYGHKLKLCVLQIAKMVNEYMPMNTALKMGKMGKEAGREVWELELEKGMADGDIYTTKAKS